jgi:hypothetical protein
VVFEPERAAILEEPSREASTSDDPWAAAIFRQMSISFRVIAAGGWISIPDTRHRRAFLE